MLNAAVEEGAYRGVFLHALDKSLGPGFAALLLQALAFGRFISGGFRAAGSAWVSISISVIAASGSLHRLASILQSAVTFQRVAAFCFTRYGSLKSLLGLCTSITLPATS
jgi:hypothetical protein